MKIKKCPFCGSDAKLEVKEEENIYAQDKMYVECKICKAKGPEFFAITHYFRKNEVIEAWNNRFLENFKNNIGGYQPTKDNSNIDYEAMPPKEE